MIRFHLTPDDLGRVRFAVSPLIELQLSVAILAHPDDHPMHAPWIRRAAPRVASLDMAMLEALFPWNNYVPDFSAPPPREPRPDPHAEIERVRASDPELVRRELAWVWEHGLPPVLRPLLEDTTTALHELADRMRDYWDRALADDWPAIRAITESDIRRRSTQLAAGGVRAALSRLHPDIELSDDDRRLILNKSYDIEVQLDGRGLLLIPSAFIWPGQSAVLDEPWQPCILYGPDGVGALWEPDPGSADQALQELLGRGRARILSALDGPVSTTDLARRLHASPAGVSAHLRVLANSGLAAATRDGRTVLYSRSPLGEQILKASG